MNRAAITTTLTTMAENIRSEIGVLANATDQRAGLQSRDEKNHAFDEIDEKTPKEDALKARLGADQPKPVPADV